MNRTITILGLALLTWSLAPLLGAQSCASGNPTTLGTVKVVNTTCSRGNRPPRTTCYNLTVACTGIPNIAVELRISEPEPTVNLRGTVVLGTGGGGTGFYANRNGGINLLTTLQKLGFRVVDRRWLGGGWFGSKTSVRKQSCRYATLLTWIHKNIHTRGAFCATGNSGGSAELCYALSSWGRGAILDVAVPTGGPPMARLDYLCIQSQAWTTKCRTLVPADRSECLKMQCNVGTHAVCTGCNSKPTAADLHADSILHPNAAVSYPRTRVHMVLGSRDCSSAAPNAMLFFNAVKTEKVMEFAPGTPHWTGGTAAGRDAIVRAILGGVACRPGSVMARAMPKVGGRFELDVHGQPSKSFLVCVSLKSSQVELPGLGWIFLGTPLFHLGSGTLGANGRGTFGVAVPNDSSLAGLEFFNQLAAGPCLTNLVQVKVLP